MKRLEAHNILIDQQHGFRKRRSCESQLIITVQDLAAGLRDGEQIDAVLLDFTKAFDKVNKGAEIRNRYNQVPHLTQDTDGKVTNSQLDTTNESQEVSPFPAGDHNAHINRRAQRHSKHKTEKKTLKIHKRSTALERSVKYLLEGLNQYNGASTSPLVQIRIKTHRCLVCMKDP